MLLIAFKDCELGVPVRLRTDGNVFNLRRLQEVLLQPRNRSSYITVADLGGGWGDASPLPAVRHIGIFCR